MTESVRYHCVLKKELVSMLGVALIYCIAVSAVDGGNHNRLPQWIFTG